jgi:hypothetical protein
MDKDREEEKPQNFQGKSNALGNGKCTDKKQQYICERNRKCKWDTKWGEPYCRDNLSDLGIAIGIAAQAILMSRSNRAATTIQRKFRSYRRNKTIKKQKSIEKAAKEESDNMWYWETQEETKDKLEEVEDLLNSGNIPSMNNVIQNLKKLLEFSKTGAKGLFSFSDSIIEILYNLINLLNTTENKENANEILKRFLDLLTQIVIGSIDGIKTALSRFLVLLTKFPEYANAIWEKILVPLYNLLTPLFITSMEFLKQAFEEFQKKMDDAIREREQRQKWEKEQNEKLLEKQRQQQERRLEEQQLQQERRLEEQQLQQERRLEEQQLQEERQRDRSRQPEKSSLRPSTRQRSLITSMFWPEPPQSSPQQSLPKTRKNINSHRFSNTGEGLNRLDVEHTIREDRCKCITGYNVQCSLRPINNTPYCRKHQNCEKSLVGGKRKKTRKNKKSKK